MTSGSSRPGRAEKSGHISRPDPTNYLELLEVVHDGVVTVSMDGRITGWNTAYANMLGYSSDEIPSLSHTGITPERWHAVEARVLEQEVLPRGRSGIYEKEYRKKDGTIIPVEIQAFLARDAEGTPIGMTAVVREITERMRGGHPTRDDHLRFARVFNGSPIPQVLFTVESDGGFVCAAVNPPYIEMLRSMGIEAEEAQIVGRSREDFLGSIGMWSEDAIAESAMYAQAIATRRPVGYEVTAPFPAGDRLMAVTITPILDDGSRPVYALWAARDVATENGATRALRESEARFRAILDATDDRFFLLVPDGTVLVHNAAVRQVYGRDIVGKSVYDLASPEISARWRARAEEALQSRSSVHVELRAPDRDSDVSIHPVPGADGTPAALVIVSRDVTRRVKAETHVMEQAKLLDRLFENALDPIAILDHDFNFVRVSESYARSGNRTVPEFIGRNHFEMYPSDFEAEALEVRRTKKSYSQSARPFVYADHPEWGTSYWDVGLVPILDNDGEVDLFLLTLRNVTEQVKADLAVRESEATLARAQEIAKVGSWEWSQTSARVMASAETYRILGRIPEEMEPTREAFLTLVHPEDRDAVHRTAAAAMERGTAFHIDFRVPLAADQERIVHMEAEAKLDSAGRCDRVIGTIQDITERVSLERAVRENEERYARVVAGSNDGIWDWNVVTGEDYLSPRWKEILGYTDSELANVDSTFFNLIHPDDRDRVTQAVQRHFETRAPYDLETRMLHKDGSVRWIRTRGESIRDATGRPVRMAGTITDVTARRIAEEERSVMASIIEATPDLVGIAHPDGRIRYINRAGREMTGWKADADLSGLRISDFHPEWVTERMDAGIAEAIEHGAWLGDTALVARDGSEIPISQVIVAHKSVDGRVEYLSTIARDIRERLRAQQSLEASLREKEVMLLEIHHRVKNNLQVVSSLLYLQASKTQDPVLRAALTESRNRIHAMTLVHETLYRSKDFSQVDFQTYLDDLLNALRNTFASPNHQIEFVTRVEAPGLGIDRAIPCGLIANELVTNALKHAFVGRENGRLEVTLDRDGDTGLRFAVADNGIGIPPERRHGTDTLGMQLVHALAAQLGGNLTIESVDGSRFTINFPL